jgi:hypothetical protein
MRSGGSAIRDKRSRDGVVPDVHCCQADGWCAGELVAMPAGRERVVASLVSTRRRQPRSGLHRGGPGGCRTDQRTLAVNQYLGWELLFLVQFSDGRGEVFGGQAGVLDKSADLDGGVKIKFASELCAVMFDGSFCQFVVLCHLSV